MKRICILLISGLPIPAVKGGAIETLSQIFIDRNEIEKKYDITLICVFNKEAEEKSKKYQYTHFVYVKSNDKIDSILRLFSRVIYRVFRIAIPFSIGFFRALKYLKHHDFDLLINETWKIYISPLIARIYPKNKIVLHLHRKGEQSKGDITKKIDQSVGHLITVSSFVAKDWIGITGRNSNNTYVLFNCCNSLEMQKSLINEERKILKKRYGIKENEKVILFFGRITNEKGVIELVQAMNYIHDIDCTLLIVGGTLDGKKQSQYEVLLDKTISESKATIVRTGYIDNKDMYKFYNISDLVVLPSTCPDAAPLTIIEAMTAGKAIITTNNGGIPEYTRDCVRHIDFSNTFIVDLATNIEELLNDNEERKLLEGRAKKQAVNYSPEKYYRDFSTILDLILSKNTKK